VARLTRHAAKVPHSFRQELGGGSTLRFGPLDRRWREQRPQRVRAI